MTYRVEITARAARDLRRLYRLINAENSPLARTWFNGIEGVLLSLGQSPSRGSRVSEDPSLRQLLHGRKRDVYRVIYAVDDADHVVYVLHIRHGACDAFALEEDR